MAMLMSFMGLSSAAAQSPMQRLFKSYSLFSQRRLDVRQHLLAQQNESLPGAACRDTRAVDIGPPEEALADGACGGVGIAEEVGAGLIQPLFQRGGVKAGADGGIEKDFSLPQRLKLRLTQEQNILVQTGNCLLYTSDAADE